MRARSFLVLMALSLCLSAAVLAEEMPPQEMTAPVAEKPPVMEKKKSSFFVSFHGGFTSGDLIVAAVPKNAPHASPLESSGYMIGVGFEGNILPEFRWFLDGMTTTRSAQVAEQGGYATSFWIYEKTGYSSHDVGPFTTDVNAYMDTTGFRLGGKYVLMAEQSFRPWVGAGFGVYRWKFSYMNSEKTKTYGSDEGTATGLTYMVGADWDLMDDTRLLVFADLTSPVATPRIENLFQTGWTWENSGNNHVLGPYRLGLAVQFAM